MRRLTARPLGVTSKPWACPKLLYRCPRFAVQPIFTYPSLPGREVTWKVAFGVDAGRPFTLQVDFGFDRKGGVYEANL